MARGHEHDTLYSLSIRNWSFTIFLGEKAVIVTSKQAKSMFFSHFNLIMRHSFSWYISMTCLIA